MDREGLEPSQEVCKTSMQPLHHQPEGKEEVGTLNDELSDKGLLAFSSSFSVPTSAFQRLRRRESNPRPAVYETAALPLSYSASVRVMSLAGLEPAASRLEDERSIRLSYRPA
jgi:hypothetical protein